MEKGLKVLAYCSDIAGAVDGVPMERLLAELRSKGINPKLVNLIGSWLQPRQASVVIGGATSKQFLIMDMVFQGTVLGPQLWNLFFEDAKRSINECLYEKIIYANHLNAYTVVPASTSDAKAIESLGKVQEELHKWASAMQIK